MSTYAVFTACPPEFSTRLTLGALARLDARFADLDRLRRTADLALVVQDSADLQGAHLTLHVDGEEWTGAPGRLDEDGSDHHPPCYRWTEGWLAARLGVERAAPTELRLPEFARAVQAWSRGAVYVFGPPAGVLLRRLNLSAFTDRLELEFLLGERPGGVVLRAHRLEGGASRVLRAH